MEINRATDFTGECSNYDPLNNTSPGEKNPDLLVEPSQEATSMQMLLAVKYTFSSVLNIFHLKNSKAWDYVIYVGNVKSKMYLHCYPIPYLFHSVMLSLCSFLISLSDDL